MSNKKYNEELIKEEILKAYIKLGRVPSSNDMGKKNGFVSNVTCIKYFGSWNNALEAAGLEVNRIYVRHDGTETCSKCNTNTTAYWFYDENRNLICRKCHDNHRYYVHGTLDPTCETGKGVIIENVVSLVLNDCEKCNTFDNFCADYDLISEKYGTINVKSTIVYTHEKIKGSSSFWKFAKKKNAKIPDTYICVGFNRDRSKIEHVWIIPGNSDMVKIRGIAVTDSIKGLKRAEQYEVNADTYQIMWNNLNIFDLPEFKNYCAS